MSNSSLSGLFAEDSKIEKGKVVPDTTAKADPVKDSYEYNKMSQEDIDRYGPGTMADFVDFEEFDGGDGQMGVAGDGQAGLEAIVSFVFVVVRTPIICTPCHLTLTHILLRPIGA